MKYGLRVVAMMVLMLSMLASIAGAQGISPPATPAPGSTPSPGAGGGMLDPDVLNLLQKGLLVLIEMAAPIAVGWALTEYKKHLAELRKQEWFLQLEDVANVAVLAAEQLGLTGDLQKFANSKLEYAIKYAEQVLEAQGIALDLDEPLAVLRMVIEAKVRENFTKVEGGAT